MLLQVQRDSIPDSALLLLSMWSLRRSGLNQSLEANVVGLSVLARTRMDQNGSWGTDVEVTALSHLLGVCVNIAIYDVQIDDYVTCGPYLVDP